MNDNQKISKIILASLKRFNPEIIGLFGSYSRNENKEGSDLDILVRFKDSISMFQLIRIENDLSEKLGIKVDLVTEGAIKNSRLKSRIEKDLQIIYKA